jgi:hypothetical protein
MCWTLPDRAPSPVESSNFRPSLCAGVCQRLPLFVARKGQEKGNVPEEGLHIDGADRALAKDNYRTDFGEGHPAAPDAAPALVGLWAAVPSEPT